MSGKIYRRTCTDCNVDFWHERPNKRKCSACDLVREQELREIKRVNSLKWTEKNKERKKAYQQSIYTKNRAKTYGLTLDEYNALQENTTCALCNNPFKNSKDKHIDHCHVSKKVRGLLCTKCNVGLGMFGDSVPLLKAAIQYIEQSS